MHLWHKLLFSLFLRFGKQLQICCCCQSKKSNIILLNMHLFHCVPTSHLKRCHYLFTWALRYDELKRGSLCKVKRELFIKPLLRTTSKINSKKLGDSTWPGVREVTPSLTLVPRTEEAVEEATEDPPRDSLLLERRTVARGVWGAEVRRAAPELGPYLLTRPIGANSPNLSLHSKYLKQGKKNWMKITVRQKMLLTLIQQWVLHGVRDRVQGIGTFTCMVKVRKLQLEANSYLNSLL